MSLYKKEIQRTSYPDIYMTLEFYCSPNTAYVSESQTEGNNKSNSLSQICHHSLFNHSKAVPDCSMTLFVPQFVQKESGFYFQYNED